VASKYDEAVLGPIVASSKTIAEVLRRLGLAPTGGNYRYINGRIRHLQLDTSHFWGRHAKRIAELTSDELAPLVACCKSVAQVATALGLPDHGGVHRDLSRRVQQLSLDTRHFQGCGWSRGETRATHPSIERAARKLALPDHEVFVENAPPSIHGASLTKRLLRMGVPYVCTMCGINDWRGKPLTLHLDHVNGIHNDNRFENLRLLCPNCHSQTETYGRRASRACEEHVLYEGSSRAWRNWLTQRL
jgi:5-methylcytosine-specific restriction endonuclease McrA